MKLNFRVVQFGKYAGYIVLKIFQDKKNRLTGKALLINSGECDTVNVNPFDNDAVISVDDYEDAEYKLVPFSDEGSQSTVETVRSVPAPLTEYQRAAIEMAEAQLAEVKLALATQDARKRYETSLADFEAHKPGTRNAMKGFFVAGGLPEDLAAEFTSSKKKG